ncbi:RING and UBP finger domain protein [Aspergillus luchuensis]|uniref:RING and UBP finger domain protein n=1 Tax=Aspergillus kawachii TaxID=1069201 RepID=A0A146FEG9_ASPKA|nr:RING and UBP finger domain protein [Aspergillus luchuensis]
MRFNDTARSNQLTEAMLGGQKLDRDEPWVKRTSGQPTLGRTAHKRPVSGLVILQYILEIANCSLDSEDMSVFPGTG